MVSCWCKTDSIVAKRRRRYVVVAVCVMVCSVGTAYVVVYAIGVVCVMVCNADMVYVVVYSVVAVCVTVYIVGAVCAVGSVDGFASASGTVHAVCRDAAFGVVHVIGIVCNCVGVGDSVCLVANRTAVECRTCPVVRACKSGCAVVCTGVTAVCVAIHAACCAAKKPARCFYPVVGVRVRAVVYRVCNALAVSVTLVSVWCVA